jgi:Rrf2 family cysteine metabolism transcriptional repressor
MRLSRKSEYSLLAMIDLARQFDRGCIKSAEISRRWKIPKPYLDQLFLILKRGGLVRSTRGAAGGYRLAKPPSDISIAQIVRLMDGPLAPVESVSRYFYEKTPVEQSPKLLKLLRQIRDSIAKTLENTSLADLV